MPTKPKNHPPAPVQEQIGIAIPPPAECAKLKLEFGIHTNTHSRNSRGPSKRTSRSYQSHHVLQDAQTAKIISRGRAIAIMLRDSHANTEHGDITARQNQRMNNKGGAGGPAGTFGALKNEAANDLVAGLKGKRRSKKTGKPMTKRQAEKLALCITAEAEKAAKKRAKAQGKTVTDKTRVPPPAGCLVRGTLVRLARGGARAVEDLRPGDRLWTPSGGWPLVRVEICYHDLVELDLGGETLAIASYHRLQGGGGEWRRADAYAPGDRLMTTVGATAITAVRQRTGMSPTYRLGFAAPTVCAIGAAGVRAAMPELGPPVVGAEPVGTRKEGAPCR